MKENGQRKTQSSMDLCNYLKSPRVDITKMKIIIGMPDRKFTNIKQLNKNMRDRTKLLPTETKKNMAANKGRTGVKENNKYCNQGRTLWAEEQVRRAFRGQTTEAKRIDRLTKAKEATRSVKDTMGHLPTKIQNQMVQRKEVKLAPSRWPVKATIHREKLQNTVG